MTLFRKAAKPVCEEIVTVTMTEVSKRIDDSAEGIGDILELGIMAVALVASIVLPHNPLTHAATSLLAIPRGVEITKIIKF